MTVSLGASRPPADAYSRMAASSHLTSFSKKPAQAAYEKKGRRSVVVINAPSAAFAASAFKRSSANYVSLISGVFGTNASSGSTKYSMSRSSSSSSSVGWMGAGGGGGSSGGIRTLR